MASTFGARIGVLAGSNYCYSANSQCGVLTSGRRSTVKQLTRIGCYQIERTIGRGNFAVVKLATHTVTKNKVAIKVIDKQKLDDDNREKIQREIKIIKLLQHPHIVRLYEVIETEDLICLVTEYASGGEMFDHLVRNGRLKEEDARARFKQLLAAVAYCHTKNVVHRDLKAENVLLDSDLNVKVADFGFGNMCGRNEFLRTHCGSPPYAAPELFEGREYEGQKADIWSLGVVLYVLVCAKLPFDDSDLFSLRSRILRGRFQVPFYVTTDCEDLIRRMMSVNPSKRIGIREILDHRWMKQPDNAVEDGEDVEFRTLMERSLDSKQVQDEPLNEEVLNHMAAAGMDLEIIRRSVTERRFDSISAIYNLLVDGYIKKRGHTPTKTVSDTSSSSSNNNNNNNNNGSSGETSVDISTDTQYQQQATIVAGSTSTMQSQDEMSNSVSPVRYKRNHRHRHQLVLPGPEILEEYEQKSLKCARRLSTVVKETPGRQHRTHHKSTAFDRNRRASDGVISLARFSGHLEKVCHQNLADDASQQVGGRSAEPSCSNLVEQLNQEYQLLQRQTGVHDLQQIDDKYRHHQQQQQQPSQTPMFTVNAFQTSSDDVSTKAQPGTVSDSTQTNNSLHWQLQQLNLQLGGQTSTTATTATTNPSTMLTGLSSTLSHTSTDYQSFQQQSCTSGFLSSTCTSANKPFSVPTQVCVPSHPRMSLASAGHPLPSQPTFRHGGQSTAGEVPHLAGHPVPAFSPAAAAVPIPQIGAGPAAFPFPAAREMPDAMAFTSAGGHRRCTTVMPPVTSSSSRHPPFQLNNQATCHLPPQFRLQLENADRQRRCSLPVMLHSIAENVQLLAAGRRDDYDVAGVMSSRKSSAATSGYATACDSVATSRKTSCTSERDEVADFTTEDYDAAANADDDDMTSSSSSSSTSSSSDEHQEMQVDDQEMTSQPEALADSQYPGITAATNCQFRTTTPSFSAYAQPEVSNSATSGDGLIIRDTNRTLFELRGEVLATLDANAVSGKLSYWRHADNNLFVIRHTYVTVGLELRPVEGPQLPPLGRMLFRQIDGDQYCYVQLCNELISRILINSSSCSS